MKIKGKILCTILAVIIFSLFLKNTIFAADGKITASSVRIRKEANTSSEVISVAKNGEKVEVIGEENGWYKVKFEDVTGYISSDFVDTDFDGNSQSASSDNEPEVPEQKTPEENKSAETQEPANEQKTSQEVSNNKQNAQTPDEFQKGTKIAVENETNVRLLPNYTSKVISNIPVGTEVEILDNLNKWVKITNGDVIGWALKSEIKTVASNTEAPEQQTPEENKPAENTSNSTSIGKVKVDSARVRKTPDGEVLGVVDMNDTVEILGEEGDWYKANIEEYKNCYISKSLVTVNN